MRYLFRFKAYFLTLKTMVFLLFIIGAVFYFIPSIIAFNKKNASSIIALNLLLGWTFIGWVVSLVWALKND